MKILSTHDLQAIMQRAENALRLREQSNKKIAEKSCGLTIGTRPPANPLFVEEPAALLPSGHLIAEHLPKGIGTVQYCPSSGSYHHRMFRLL